MPSWNIHTAHVERLLREEGAAALGVRDENAFLLGNLAPDVYVGYMVPNPSFRIDYKLTHLALREHIPLPRYDDFWDFYIAGRDDVSDVVLGAWAHLVADHVYNAHTRAYLASIGVEPGERARIGKQGDVVDKPLFGDIAVIDQGCICKVEFIPVMRKKKRLSRFRILQRFGNLGVRELRFLLHGLFRLRALQCCVSDFLPVTVLA